MINIKLKLIITLFIGIASLSFANDNNINVSEENLAIEDPFFDKKLDENLYAIAFSAKSLEIEKAMNFLLDYPDQTYTSVYDLLFNDQINNNNLINIWNIINYMQTEQERDTFPCKDLESLYSIQNTKHKFMGFVIKQMYGQCNNITEKYIKDWLDSSDVLFYTEAFNIISENRLNQFNQDILNIILNKDQEDLLKQKIAITTLSQLDNSNIDLTPLIHLIKTGPSYLYNSIVLVLNQDYPDKAYFKILRKFFLKNNLSPLQKSIVIKSLFYDFSQTNFNFMVSIYPNNYMNTSEINRFIQNFPLTEKNLNQITYLYKKLSHINLKIRWFQLVDFLVPQYQRYFLPKEILKQQLLKSSKNYYFLIREKSVSIFEKLDNKKE